MKGWVLVDTSVVALVALSKLVKVNFEGESKDIWKNSSLKGSLEMLTFASGGGGRNCATVSGVA